jgi:hypothetical protein
MVSGIGKDGNEYHAATCGMTYARRFRCGIGKEWTAPIIAAILLVLSNIIRTFAKVLAITVMAILIFCKTCNNIFITI